MIEYRHDKLVTTQIEKCLNSKMEQLVKRILDTDKRIQSLEKRIRLVQPMGAMTYVCEAAIQADKIVVASLKKTWEPQFMDVPRQSIPKQLDKIIESVGDPDVKALLEEQAAKVGYGKDVREKLFFFRQGQKHTLHPPLDNCTRENLEGQVELLYGYTMGDSNQPVNPDGQLCVQTYLRLRETLNPGR